MARRRALKKQYAVTVDAELDLHGHTATEARAAVDAFLQEASRAGWLRVRIIVGKGTRSVGGVAVLPDTVKGLLNRRGYHYTYAKMFEGGEGALEVRL